MNTKPEFKNRQNKMYHTKNDGVKWDSRACAVVAHIWCKHNGEYYVLVGKRGPKMDNAGLLNVPCGYLDWDENFYDGVRREVFEETGLDLTMFSDNEYNSGSQPWYVHTEPTENRQNVSLHYGFVFENNKTHLPKLSLENMEPGESDGAYWFKLSEIEKMDDNIWAFKHKARIAHFKTHLNK